MTEAELDAIKDGFKSLSDRISDLEAKLKQKGDIPDTNKDGGMKFDELPDELKEDKSKEIRQAWYDKPLF